MSLVNSNSLILAAGGDYQISRSVRLRSSASAYFNRTPASASNRRTMTLSTWQKRGEFASSQEPAIMWAGTGGSNYTLFRWGDGVGDANSKFKLNLNMFSSSTTNINLVTTPLYRDPSAWYHIVLSIDTTQATAANRVRLYINGIEVTSFSSATYPSQNLDLFFNSTNAHEIGRFSFGSYLDGYMTEINFIDGQQLTPSSFGETNPITGVWQPKKYAGTYGTNGFFLTFQDNSAATATTIGKDYSGNGNNWTPNNISVTAGVTYDSMLDVPTLWADGGNGRGNYCTLNPLIVGGLLGGGAAYGATRGNLRGSNTGSGGWASMGSTFVATSGSGRWYWEVTYDSGAAGGEQAVIGIHRSIGVLPTGIVGYTGDSDGYSYGQSGNKFNNSTGTAYGTSWSPGDVIGVALDCSTAGAASVTFYRNNSSQGVAFSSLTGDFMPAISTTTSGLCDVNFGQRPFSYTPPTGFKALNTGNLPEPTIVNGSKWMDINLWTGDQSARTITNSGAMQPDFLWTKSRSNAEDHRLSDSVRGGNGTVLDTLASNTTGAQANDTDVTGFTSTGFNIRAGTNSPNVTGRTYVGWQWKASGTTVTNTSGSITSTVSVSTTAGFSVLRYTGTGAAATVGHGLGVTPQMVIVKRRDSGPSSWTVWHNSFSSIEYIYLNLTNTKSSCSGSTVWNSTLPTSSVFSLGTYTDVNASGGTYVAYLFAPVAGYSAFGTYTGNGSSAGPFVYLGFRPEFIMIKRTDTTASWLVVDAARSPNNTSVNGGMQNVLFPNLSNAEDTGADVCDGVSNGFKFYQGAASFNANGGTYIYMAFAQNPFKYALAR